MPLASVSPRSQNRAAGRWRLNILRKWTIYALHADRDGSSLPARHKMPMAKSHQTHPQKRTERQTLLAMSMPWIRERQRCISLVVADRVAATRSQPGMVRVLRIALAPDSRFTLYPVSTCRPWNPIDTRIDWGRSPPGVLRGTSRFTLGFAVLGIDMNLRAPESLLIDPPSSDRAHYNS
jgi:hypothetical protein